MYIYIYKIFPGPQLIRMTVNPAKRRTIVQLPHTSKPKFQSKPRSKDCHITEKNGGSGGGGGGGGGVGGAGGVAGAGGGGGAGGCWLWWWWCLWVVLVLVVVCWCGSTRGCVWAQGLEGLGFGVYD